ncbi:hypothetical protein HIM_06750 [Hirsutella minnesotensis 3608]|uniref:Aminoglycoside phosphotransferase domain-containing protein n=1 Tax=Hirsutella minnesotensis 3608 TaxID=1043627 RepID=A0A0F7ZZA0_9HYPO|nr:hypothetical protein HIM_06750 [Hirsutella minnesotensis 3608]
MPVVRDAWGKLVSEVTTMRHVQSHTSIRIPRVYAFGRDDTLVRGSLLPFMLMECVPGRPLDTRTWMHTTESQRQNLYTDLINTLAQLRALEFSKSGSLMPGPDDASSPIVGPSFSMTANEYERSCRLASIASRVFTSTKEFADYYCALLSGTYKQPVQDLEREQAMKELFALDSLLGQVTECIPLHETCSTFVLAHPDLRCGNVMIDDDFHIVSIIDWEFAITVPLRFFTPPSWITGHDPNTIRMVTGVPRETIFMEFCAVLIEMAKTSTACSLLCQDWSLKEDQDTHDRQVLLEISPIAQILRQPSGLVEVYYATTFRRLFGRSVRLDAVVNDFFEKDKNQVFAQRVEQMLRDSGRYTEYLRTRGLLEVDDYSWKIEQFLEKTKHLVPV